MGLTLLQHVRERDWMYVKQNHQVAKWWLVDSLPEPTAGEWAEGHLVIEWKAHPLLLQFSAEWSRKQMPWHTQLPQVWLTAVWWLMWVTTRHPAFGPSVGSLPSLSGQSLGKEDAKSDIFICAPSCQPGTFISTSLGFVIQARLSKRLMSTGMRLFDSSPGDFQGFTALQKVQSGAKDIKEGGSPQPRKRGGKDKA